MKKIHQHQDIDLAPHTDHYSDRSGSRIVKVQPDYLPPRERVEGESHVSGWAVFYSDPSDDGYNHEFRNMDADWVKRFLRTVLGRQVAETGYEAGTCYVEHINQANREVEVISVAQTRCRIEYEMPNTGFNGAWRAVFKLGNYTYIGDSWTDNKYDAPDMTGIHDIQSPSDRNLHYWKRSRVECIYGHEGTEIQCADCRLVAPSNDSNGETK